VVLLLAAMAVMQAGRLLAVAGTVQGQVPLPQLQAAALCGRQ
jgi:hypothetical protein